MLEFFHVKRRKKTANDGAGQATKVLNNQEVVAAENKAKAEDAPLPRKKGMRLPNFVARFTKHADEPPKTEEEKKQLNTKALDNIKQKTAAAETQNKQTAEMLKTAVKESKAKATGTSVFDSVAEEDHQRLQKDAGVIVDAMKQRQTDKEKQDEARLLAQLAEEIMQQEEEAKRSGIPKYMVNMLTFGRPRIDLSFFGNVSEAGLHRWRIQKLHPVPESTLPDNEFLSGECYIVLHVPPRSEQLETAPAYNERAVKVMQLYTWVGKDSSLDKRACAAIWAIYLNHYVYGKAKLILAEEGGEPIEFQALFSGTLEQKQGLVSSSGLRTIPESVFSPLPVLYQLYDDQFIKANASNDYLFGVRREALSAASLNASSCFLLVDGKSKTIYQWHGAKTNINHHFAAHEFAHAINRTTLLHGAQIILVDKADEAHQRRFWQLLGVEGDIEKAKQEASTRVFNEDVYAIKSKRQLYGTVVKDGAMDMELVYSCQRGSKGLKRGLLTSNRVFVLDCDSEIFVWKGSASSIKERAAMMTIAENLRGSGDRPAHATVVSVHEGVEPAAFSAQFSDWLRLAQPPSGKVGGLNTVHSAPPLNFEHLAKEDAASFPEENIQVLGTATTEVLVQESMNNYARLEEGERGQFFSGNAYAVLYTYTDKVDKRQKCLVYFWIGKDASLYAHPRFILGIYRMLEANLKALQNVITRKVVVYQHKEPEHFLSLFNNRVVVHRGLRGKQAEKKDQIILYHIQASPNHYYAFQTTRAASVLNTRDTFVLDTNEKIIVWHGQLSNRAAAEPAVAVVLKSIEREGLPREDIDEGKEEVEFWHRLLLFENYSFPYNAEFATKHQLPPRLLHLSHFGIAQIPRFAQFDLDEDQCYLLDTYFNTYLWLGKQASDCLKRIALEYAEKITAAASASRSQEIKVVSVPSGQEPPEFTCHFAGWAPPAIRYDPMVERQKKVKLLEQEEAKRRALREKKERRAVRKMCIEARNKRLDIPTPDEEPQAEEQISPEEEEDEELAKIPADLKCSGCGKKLGPFSVTFGDRSWHPQCFTCVRCKASLNDGFMEGEKDKAFYCSHCHSEVYGEICSGCSKALGLQVKRAIGQNWHPECFNCTNCKKSLDAEFVNKNNLPYCLACDEELFYEKCAGCAKSLIGEALVAVGKKWHPDCFVCSTCKTVLGDNFIEEGGKAFCAACDPSVCAGCEKSLGYKRLFACDKKWHPNCFVCTNCKQDLGTDFMEHNGMPYCEPCDTKLFAELCYCCSKPLWDNCVGLEGKKWHVECLRCSRCSTPFTEPNFRDIDRKLYCTNCDLQEACGGCGKPIGIDPFLVALEKKWHRDCLLCTGCQKPVKEFVEEDGAPYCNQCVRERKNQQASKCASCQEPLINTKFLTALEKEWHVTCFVCHSCRRSLDDGFIEHKGLPYCGKDHCKSRHLGTENESQAFESEDACAGCSKELGDQRVGALGKKWHRECFVCKSCKGDLSEGYVEFEGFPYCDACDSKLQKQRAPTPAAQPQAQAPAAAQPQSAPPAPEEICPGCSNALGPKRVVALDKKWHPECLVCTACRGSLAGGFLNRGGMPYCGNCPAPEEQPAAAPAPQVPAEDLCPACSKPLGPQRVGALGKKWHKDCFVCTGCKAEISGGFVDHGGFPYCASCPAPTPSAPAHDENTCPACNTALSGARVSALGKKWHKDCFVCTGCKGSLADGFINKNDRPYCGECPESKAPSTSAPAPTAPAEGGSAVAAENACGGCGKPLGAQRVAAMDKKWHKECFVCSACKGPLAGGFYARNGAPICSNCK